MGETELTNEHLHAMEESIAQIWSDLNLKRCEMNQTSDKTSMTACDTHSENVCKIVTAGLSLCLTFASIAASAGGVMRNTTIDYVATQGKGMQIIPKTINGVGLTGQPSCVRAGWGNILVADAGTPQGRMNIAVALAAHAQGRKVDLGGAGTCNVNGAAEDLAGILVR